MLLPPGCNGVKYMNIFPKDSNLTVIQTIAKKNLNLSQVLNPHATAYY